MGLKTKLLRFTRILQIADLPLYINLSGSHWTSGNGHHLDRNLNAAKNILKKGLNDIARDCRLQRQDDSICYGNTSVETKPICRCGVKYVVHSSIDPLEWAGLT